MKVTRRLIACASAAALLSAPLGALAQKFNLRMGHAVATTDGQHAAAVKMAELVKQRTNGDVSIAIVSSGASNYNGTA